MSPEESESIHHQLREWVAGNPTHNEVRNECCPDFSCCQPELLWPEEQRELFANADDRMREAMLLMSLGAALNLMSEDYRDGVYIAGLDGGTMN